MIIEIVYTVAIIFLLLFLIFASVYLILLSYSMLKGAPYVATTNDEILAILSYTPLPSGARFYDLGCGDGRVARAASRLYDVHAVGIDINPYLILLARIRTHMSGLQKIVFHRGDILKVDISAAQVVYIYLLPHCIARLKDKFQKELSDNTIIISHAFRIPYLESSLIDTKKGPVFTTYYYKIKKNTH